MSDTTKIRSKLSKLERSFDELESQLEPLFEKSLPESLLALDTIQQAKVQTIIPYVAYDLVFVYLKSRGIDPRTHRVVAELERVRQYFDKIKHAEESEQKRKIGLDKEAAGRFIKHAIAQAKNAQLVDEPSDAGPSSSSNHERVPPKVTSKMLARAEYEKELEGLETEEDGLEVFDDEMAVEGEEAMDTTDGPPETTTTVRLDKGKGRASEQEQFNSEQLSSSRRKRPRIDPFTGCEDLSVSEPPQPMDNGKKAKPIPTSDDREAKAAKRKAKKLQKFS